MPSIPLTLPPSTVADLHHVRDRLEAHLERHLERAAAQGPDSARLWGVAAASVLGGKLVRPAILLMATRALTPDAPADDPAPAPATTQAAPLEAATAVELLHTAFLLHDDVIDNDTLRRGEPNLLGRSEAIAGRPLGPDSQRTLGAAAAILVGDVLVADAHQIIARLAVPHEVRLRMLNVLDETFTQSVAGEFSDVLYSLPEIAPDLQAVLAMSARKTGVYTIRLPLMLALAVTGTPAPDGLEEYCIALGLAFQLQDDLLGVFGAPEEVGKDPYSDVREGKATALIAHASTCAQWPELAGLLGRRDLNPSQGARAVELLEQCGARAAVERDVQQHLATAQRLAGAIAGRQGYGEFGEVLRLVALAIAGRRS